MSTLSLNDALNAVETAIGTYQQSATVVSTDMDTINQITAKLSTAQQTLQADQQLETTAAAAVQTALDNLNAAWAALHNPAPPPSPSLGLAARVGRR